MWNWSQQHDFYLCWAKSCMGLPWVIPVIHWFCLKQLILSILSTFQVLKIWKIKFCCKQLWICVKLVTTTWLLPLLSKKLHGTTFSHTCDTLILLKTAYFKHLSTFQLLKIWKIKVCCKPLGICVKLVTTTWLSPLLSKKMHGNNLRHTWDTVILLKTA